jgi:hypothetical protein
LRVEDINAFIFLYFNCHLYNAAASDVIAIMNLMVFLTFQELQEITKRFKKTSEIRNKTENLCQGLAA